VAMRHLGRLGKGVLVPITGMLCVGADWPEQSPIAVGCLRSRPRSGVQRATPAELNGTGFPRKLLDDPRSLTIRDSLNSTQGSDYPP
jgi:hypothetical protein